MKPASFIALPFRREGPAAGSTPRKQQNRFAVDATVESKRHAGT